MQKSAVNACDFSAICGLWLNDTSYGKSVWRTE